MTGCPVNRPGCRMSPRRRLLIETAEAPRTCQRLFGAQCHWWPRILMTMQAMAKETTDAVTALILETFRLNGRLLVAGDRLVEPIGLTSARWQVLGAIANSRTALPVAQIARNMGLTRQSVQRLADEMARSGLVRFVGNPHHKRAKLVVLTPQGESIRQAAGRLQGPWAHGLADGLSIKQINAAVSVLQTIRTSIDKQVDERADGRNRQGRRTLTRLPANA
jgi:DNA-binding MarR family transcriptional regulator